MKNIKMMMGLIAIISITSCTVTKKRYSSGYHVEWKNNKTTANHEIIEKSEDPKQSEKLNIANEEIDKMPPKNLEASIESKKLYIEQNLIIDKIKKQKIDDEPKNKKDSRLIREVTKEKRDGTILTKRRYSPQSLFNKKEVKAIWSLFMYSLLGYLAYSSMLFGLFAFIFSFMSRKEEMKSWAKKGIWLFGIALTLKLISILIGLWVVDGMYWYGNSLTLKNFLGRVFNVFYYW